MNMKLNSIVFAVAETFQDRGVTPFEAGAKVFTVAHWMGYPQPEVTGVWPQDIPGLLRVVSHRIRTDVAGERA